MPLSPLFFNIVTEVLANAKTRKGRKRYIDPKGRNKTVFVRRYDYIRNLKESTKNCWK